MKKIIVIVFVLVAGLAVKTKAQTVYSSSHDTRYHTADCKLSGNDDGLNYSDARREGKTACDICRPDDHFDDKTVQCSGRNDDGSRCTRWTSSGDGRCYLHTNHAPVANDQNVTTNEDVAKAIRLTAGDADGNTLTYTIVVPPSHGTLSGTAPNVTYSPSFNYSGSDSFKFKANDGIVDSNTATVSITINANNTIALSSGAGSDSQNLCVNTAMTSITYTTTGATGATFSGLPAGVVGSWASNAVTISGTPTATGVFNYTVTMTGGCPGGTNTAKGSITVNANNTIALSSGAGSDSQNLCVNTAMTSITYITTGATGATFSGLPAGVVGSWTSNAVTISGTPTATGVFNYTVTMTGGCPGGTNTAMGSIIVNAVNHAPVASNQSVTTDEDVAKLISLNATDVDGNTLNYSIVTPPSHGTLTGAAPNVTYTPSLYYNGSDSFTFKANDGTVDSNTATVSITITPVNHAPIAIDQSISTVEYAAKEITLSATDVDGNTLTFLVVTQPTHGSLTGTAPNVTYTPALFYHGPDSFTFSANDGTVDSNIATVSINVGYPPLKIYDGVSPNGDNINDYWRIDGIESFPNNLVRVYDRFNNVVFEVSAYSNDNNNWRGQSNHGLVQGTLPEGTYFYTVSLGNGEHAHSGYVVLKRN